jgi:hypothetical protein
MNPSTPAIGGAKLTSAIFNLQMALCRVRLSMASAWASDSKSALQSSCHFGQVHHAQRAKGQHPQHLHAEGGAGERRRRDGADVRMTGLNRSGTVAALQRIRNRVEARCDALDRCGSSVAGRLTRGLLFFFAATYAPG